jgi:hypothetical protein
MHLPTGMAGRLFFSAGSQPCWARSGWAGSQPATKSNMKIEYNKLLHVLIMMTTLFQVNGHGLRKLEKEEKTLDIYGNWTQMYNNRYVQETTEIDWDCVHVSFLQSGPDVILQKSGIQHHPRHVTLPSIKYHLHEKNNTFSLMMVVGGRARGGVPRRARLLLHCCCSGTTITPLIRRLVTADSGDKPTTTKDS